MGGSQLLEQAQGDLAMVTGLIRNGRHTAAVEFRLYALATRVSYITGWMAYKAGGALHRAYDLWGKRDGDELPAWLGWYGEAQLHSTEGKVMLRSGQVDRATDALAASVDQAAPRDQAVRVGRLATARLAGRDLDGALDAAHRGFALLEDRVHSARAVSRLRKFEGYLMPHYAEPAVAEFRARLHALPAMAA